MRYSPLLCILLLASCTPRTETQPNDTILLEPYLTRTPSFTATPHVLTFLDTPFPTATLFYYQVEDGDTLSEIAEQFKISMDDLRAANPEISPNTLAIGETLIIPDPGAGLASASTPTPVPVSITQTGCYPSADGGGWCYGLIHNPSNALMENVSAKIILLDKDGQVFENLPAFLPLDILPPNSSLPVYSFFAEMPAEVQPQVQMLSAYTSDGQQYLPAELHKTIALIDASVKTAQLSGEIILPEQSPAADRVWVAAVAYDGNGRVVGVKRWEGGAIPPGGGITFSFFVSSYGAEIETVDFFVQATGQDS